LYGIKNITYIMEDLKKKIVEVENTIETLSPPQYHIQEEICFGIFNWFFDLFSYLFFPKTDVAPQQRPKVSDKKIE